MYIVLQQIMLAQLNLTHLAFLALPPFPALPPFQILHCDLWTSPTVSFSGFKYYFVVLDHFKHYTWTF